MISSIFERVTNDFLPYRLPAISKLILKQRYSRYNFFLNQLREQIIMSKKQSFGEALDGAGL
jgi:hypothetical protein